MTRGKLAIHWQILIALVLGVGVGLAINQWWTKATWQALGVVHVQEFLAHQTPAKAAGVDAAARAADVHDPGVAAYLVRFGLELNQFVGDVFLRVLRFVAVPIVLFSLIAGAASIGNPRALGRIGVRTVLIFVATTVLSIAIGLGLANVFGPGRGISPEAQAALMEGQKATAQARIASAASAGDSLSIWKQVLDTIPSNPFAAIANAQMLQVITFALVIGVGLTALPAARARPLIDAFGSLTDIMINLVQMLMKAAPVAVFCLMTPVAARLGTEALRTLGAYCVLFTVGLALVTLVMYPVILLVFARYSPAAFFRGLSPAILTAVSTSSSVATIPVTLECTQNRLGVSKRIASFVVTLGATINMNGTAMYIAMGVLFIAQVYNIDIPVSAQVTILLTATLAAIGTPGIPSASIVFIIVILEDLKVPAAGIALLLAVDGILDRLRTIVNITGDAMTAVVVARAEGELSVPGMAEGGEAGGGGQVEAGGGVGGGAGERS